MKILDKLHLILAAIGFFTIPISYAKSSGFVGKWQVQEIVYKTEQNEWIKPHQLPASLIISSKDGKLVADYIDQSGVRLPCNVVLEIIEGNELMIYGCPSPIKSNTKFSPIHRIQLRGNGNARSLVGLTIAEQPLYTWAANLVMH